MNLLFRIIGILVVIVVVLLTALTLAGGRVIRSFVNDRGPQLIGRTMQVSDASFNAFTGQLSIDSLQILEADGSTPFLSFSTFRARLSVPRLLLGTYDLNDVDLNRLRLHVEQRDTVFNFSDILQHLASDDDDEPLPLVLRNINIRDSHIRYQDLLVRSDFRIDDFNLFIPGIDLRDINTSLGMHLSFVDGGELQTQVEYDSRRQTYSLDLHLDGFNLQSLLPYVRQQIEFGEVQGMLNVNLVMQGSLKHVLDFSLRGDAGVRGLNVLDPHGDALVTCDTVSIGVRDLNLTQSRMELSSLVFHRPTIRLEYGADSLDSFSRLVVQAQQAPVRDDIPFDGVDPQVASAGASVSFNGRERDMRLVIDRFTIEDAALSYRDESLQGDPFVYDLSQLNVSALNFSLDARNHITVQSHLGHGGNLRLTYDGRLTDHSNMRLQLVADGIDFADFSPYTVQMFGNEVTSGKLSVNVLASTVNGELNGQNRFYLTDPKVEKKRRGVHPEMNIPFRTGMYILTDRNNVCDIDVPVHGNLNEPRFSYKRLIFRTLGRLIVKVCTSPFRRSGSNSSGVPFSAEEVLQLDDRPLDSISLDSISSDMLKDE